MGKKVANPSKYNEKYGYFEIAPPPRGHSGLKSGGVCNFADHHRPPPRWLFTRPASILRAVSVGFGLARHSKHGRFHVPATAVNKNRPRLLVSLGQTARFTVCTRTQMGSIGQEAVSMAVFRGWRAHFIARLRHRPLMSMLCLRIGDLGTFSRRASTGP